MTSFRELTGYEKIKAGLTAALLSNRVSHAYLFYGPSNAGKKNAGLAFARALLCSGGGGDACEACDDCNRSRRGVHPDLHLIRPDGASIKIRQLKGVCNEAVFTSFGEGRQVFLVEQAEKMTAAAANSFLKTLEEPAAGVVFILVTDDIAAIPSTVLSRCQCYRFNGLSPVLPDGSAVRDRALELALNLAAAPRTAVPVPPEDLSGREDTQQFVNYLTALFRDVMVMQQAGRGELLINCDRQDDVAVLAGAYGRREVLDILLTAEETTRRLAGNANQRLALDSLLLKIAGY